MRKYIYICPILFLLLLTGCKEDLTEYYEQLDLIEADQNAISEGQKKIKQGQDETGAEHNRAQQYLDSLNRAINSVTVDPKLLTFEFVTADNRNLESNVKAEIIGDSVVECWIPTQLSNKQLIPRFTFDGTSVTIDGNSAVSGQTTFDFTDRKHLTVSTPTKQQEYEVYVHAFTGLPVVTITTQGGREVTSKDYYISATFKMVEDVRTRSAGDVISVPVQIKGRGNSTWRLPKKPYRLKFNEKISLLGEHKDRNWVLLANYSDKSMLRNQAAFYLGQLSSLDWTPHAHFVDVIFNGRYDGTYQLCENIRIDNHRVAVGDNGFIVEVEARAPDEEDSRYFYTNYIDYALDIKDPDVEYGDANYNYIVDYIRSAEWTLFQSFFADPNNGWQKYMDINSFVDWYLIHEISKNEDSMFHFSTYMNLKRGGKLKMGPIWDFDIAFGNVKENSNTTAMLPTGFMLNWSRWYSRLMKDPVFVAKLKERFNYFDNHRDDVLNYINLNGQYLRYSAQQNENRWGTFYHWTYKNYDIWGSYQNEVQSLKDWFNRRMDWMRTEINRM